MTKTDVLNHFQNSVTKAADGLERSKGAISKWPEKLSFEIQCYVEKMTKGALKAERPEAEDSVA